MLYRFILKPDFTLHQYRVFLKVADLGSITRAANLLAIPQPSVSRSISRIEATLKVKLIERNRNGVSLTDAGQRFQAHVREALRHFDLAALAASQDQSELSGEVRFAAPESVARMIFGPLVTRFQELYPAAKVRVMTSASVHIPSLLDNQVVDIGIIADTHPAPGGRPEILCREDFYLVGPGENPQKAGKTVKLKNIAGLPLILNAMHGGFRARIDEAFQKHGLKPDVIAEIDANEPLLDLVLENAGYSILPFSAIARRGRAGQFSAARIVSPGIERCLKLVQTSQQPLSAIGRETARLVRLIVAEQAATARWRLEAGKKRHPGSGGNRSRQQDQCPRRNNNSSPE